MTTYLDEHLLTRAHADDPLAVRTLAAIAASNLTASGARLTVT